MICVTHHHECDCREAAHAAEVDRLRAEVAAAEDRALRFADLLAATCDALRGPPPPLSAWSWHDLPSHALALREGEQGMAAALRRERDLALREALEDVAAVRTASARLCRCGSGAHPRRCELHPLAYDAHCARLRHAQEDEERARREALEEATAVCECVETVGLAEGASYCAALLRALLAGEAAP